MLPNRLNHPAFHLIRNPRPWMIFFSFILCFFQACRLPDLVQSTVTPPAAQLLFQDDFSDPASGWDILDMAPSGSVGYFDGAYRITTHIEHLFLWSQPGFQFQDVRVEVDAQKIGGAENDQFGIICRSNGESFYFLVISSDGYYGIGKMEAGRQILIGMSGMPPSEVINRGLASNHLQAECFGERLSLAVNGAQLASVTDSALPAGDVGLLAGSLAPPGNEVVFDNFSVTKPTAVK
jgi:hypothetical protein